MIDLAGLVLTSIEQIDAGAGDDTIIASLSSDWIIGGGGHDAFVFNVPSGHDTVADFHVHASGPATADVVDLTGLGISGFAALLGLATQDGGDTVITLDGYNSIRLNDVDSSTLTQDDFIFF